MDLARPRINEIKYLPSRNNEEEGATNGFEQDEANRLEQELSMLNRQKTELIESSRGCFLICYRLLRPFQVHLRIRNVFCWSMETGDSTSVPSEYLFTRVLTREYLFFDTF